MGRERLVIIGNGMAPGRMLEHLFRLAPDRYDVTIFNAEPRVNYNRLMLSPVLAGEKSYADIITHDDAWYESHGITLHKGMPVVAIDRATRTVTGKDGTASPYDQLVIATGSTPFVPPVPGHDLAGVLTYRDLDDVEAMLEASARGGRAVVIGGGLLGLEAAAGLRTRGMDVTVLHLMPGLMERQLDDAAGAMLAHSFEDRGIHILTQANTKSIEGNSRVERVCLADGTVIECDLVVMAVGIRPASWLAKDAGLVVNRGVVVDDQLQTSDPAIFALGECAEHRGTCYGLVAPLYEMAETLASVLAGSEASYAGSAISTRLKVSGIDLFSAGDFAAAADREDIVLRDDEARTYRRLVLKEGRLIGAVLYGETADGPWFFDKLRDGTSIEQDRDRLVFGRPFDGVPALGAYGGRCSLGADG
jgi:nitrite reductase (NADH) large subunit